MALVWFKSVNSIVEEGGELIEGSREDFYDQRASDSMTWPMIEQLTNSLGPYRSQDWSSGFKAPRKFGIEDDSFTWYAPWVKLWIPTGFKVKRRL